MPSGGAAAAQGANNNRIRLPVRFLRQVLTFSSFSFFFFWLNDYFSMESRRTFPTLFTALELFPGVCRGVFFQGGGECSRNGTLERVDCFVELI